jgi:transcriptional regulator with XRE-family HTH domain
MLLPGRMLRTLREQLGLSMRDVEIGSSRIAAKHGNDDFGIALSRLSDIEAKGVIPNIYKFYALAMIYRRDFRELLSWYGIDLNEAASDMGLSKPRTSHRNEALRPITAVRIPVRMDSSFDTGTTINLGRMVEQWGIVALAYLDHFAARDYTYAYIGTGDFTMYPILPPGSFVQIDESRDKVASGMWHSEYQRPIYFVETRDGHTCCWCTLKGDRITLQPHPLSPQPTRVLRHPQEADVIGQVVGVAMRLETQNCQKGVCDKSRTVAFPTSSGRRHAAHSNVAVKMA